MEALTQVWVFVISICSGISVAGIVSAIVYGVINGHFKKTVAKLNVKEVCKETIDETLAGLKSITYKHEIQPLVESGLEQVTEKANAYIDKGYEALEMRYRTLINILEKLSAYFDNSIGVSDQAKAELKQAIAEAKQEEVKHDFEVALEVEEPVEQPTEVKQKKNISR